MQDWATCWAHQTRPAATAPRGEGKRTNNYTSTKRQTRSTTDKAYVQAPKGRRGCTRAANPTSHQNVQVGDLVQVVDATDGANVDVIQYHTVDVEVVRRSRMYVVCRGHAYVVCRRRDVRAAVSRMCLL